MASLRQTSFAAGELSPRLWGRTDLPLYRHGLRRLRDFFVSRQGEAVTRPGTRFVGTGYANEKSRLAAFIVSESEGYLLEFTSASVRIWKDGVVITTLVYPWSFTPLADLQWTQSGDVMTICARYDVFELRRTSATTFTLGAKSFTRPAIQWQNVDTNAKTSAVRLRVDTLLAATTTTPAKAWRWWVSAVLQDGNGRTFESEAYEVTDTITSGGVTGTYNGTAAVGPDRPVKLARSTSVGLWTGSVVYKVLGYNYYRGVGDYSGFVGHTTKELEWIDSGEEPDYTLPHPRVSDPFVIPAPSSPAPTGWNGADYPLTVAYFEDRLVFGGTFLRPVSVLLSATGDYIDFVRPAVPVASQALEFELVSRKREKMRATIGLQRLLCLTDAGAYSLGGQGALTPTSVEVRLISEKGSAPVAPVVLEGGHVLYVRARGRGLQLLRESENAVGLYGSADVSWHAEHFFRPIETLFRITEMAYQETPWSLVWAVREDGSLLAAQWADGVLGFGLCATGAEWGDRFESVAVVPEADEDVVYLCVLRGSTYTIERLASRLRNGVVTDDCAVDSALAFTAATGSPEIDVAAAAHLIGREVWCVAKDNAPVGPITVSATGKVNLATAGFRLPTANNGANVTGWVGLLFQPELETLDVVSPDARLLQKTIEKVGVEVSESVGFSAGQNPDKLVQWTQRRAPTAYILPPAESVVVDLPVKGGWDEGARVTLKQTLPLPLTVLGLTRKVDVGG